MPQEPNFRRHMMQTLTNKSLSGWGWGVLCSILKRVKAKGPVLASVQWVKVSCLSRKFNRAITVRRYSQALRICNLGYWKAHDAITS